MSGLIYMLTFVSGKSYVGFTTKTANKRFRQHEADARNGSDLLVHRAWRKHGAPTITVLAILSKEELPHTEIRAIKAFNTLSPNGYNATPGGDISPALTPAVAAKIGARHKGRIIGPEWRAKMSLAMKGKKKSDETRSRMSASLRTRICKPETRIKRSILGKANSTMLRTLAADQKGKPLSEEHRANIGLASKRMWATDGYRAKIVSLFTGRHLTNATRLKISASNKGRKWRAEDRKRFSQKKRIECASPEGRERMRNIRRAA
jgi:hypothetical protein